MNFIYETSGQQLEVIRQLVENGSIKPVIDKVYDFKETQAALEYSIVVELK
ncbi:hypothetical protein SD1155_03830 [Sulfitobacter donghicola]|nr:hypothetical protein SD1155_03830 [Sulfitobacter donghicola]